MKVIISGMGPAGLALVQSLYETKAITLQAGVCREGGRKVGRDLGQLAGVHSLGAPVVALENLEAALFYYEPDVIVDFSRPEVTLQVAELCCRFGIGLLVGTTGFTPDEVHRMKTMALTGKFALLYVPNIAQSVTVLSGMVCYSACHLSGLDFQTAQPSYEDTESALPVPNTVTQTALQNGQHDSTSAQSAKSERSDHVFVVRETPVQRPLAGSVISSLSHMSGKRGWLEMIDVFGFR